MNRCVRAIALLSMTLAIGACGAPTWSGFYLPVDSDLKPFVAPGADELVVEDAADSGDEGGDYEDYEDYEEEAEEAPAAPTPAPKG